MSKIQDETLEVLEGVQLEISNRDYRDYCMGYSYPEDTWSIKSYGKDEDDAIENIIDEYISSGIDVSSVYLSKCLYTSFRGKEVLLEEGASMPSSSYDIIKRVEESAKYVKQQMEIKEKARIAKEHAEKLNAELAIKLQKLKAIEEEEKDLTEYERLKKKYENRG